jgi:exopolyphosphatase/guanosine-5'-triphosphate,3'-diphosphate pyrophosphatase
VRILASILRLAESLDRSHAQVVSALDLQDRGKELQLELRTSGDAELELWAAQRHVEPFEELMQKRVRLALHQAVNADTAARRRPSGRRAASS